jgi:predicted small metal-binding protein
VEADMKTLKCADVGFQCEGVIKAESEDEVLRQAAAHAKQVHQVDVTPEIAEKVKAAIRTE